MNDPLMELLLESAGVDGGHPEELHAAITKLIAARVTEFAERVKDDIECERDHDNHYGISVSLEIIDQALAELEGGKQ